MEYVLIIIVAILVFTCISLKSPLVRGEVGEFLVRLVIGRTKENEKYVINNYQVSINNKSMQIDHIVINKNGVYVIETKNYSGRIYGAESQTKWTQVLAYGKVKNYFYNPIMQNETHLRNLEQIIEMDGVSYKNIVVFIGNNTYKINSDKLIKLSSIKETILSPISQKTLTEKEMTAVYNKIIAYKSENEISTFEHIENIKEIQEQINENICPRCGNKLIEKQGKYGQFLGCSNYPNCKFIKKL